LVFIIGGGTGSAFINSLGRESQKELIKYCQIIHITGHSQNEVGAVTSPDFNYQVFSFLDHQDILEIMKRSEVVVSRCGLGVLTELSALGKPSILIPMPHSHQEDNAQVFAEAQAAIVLSEETLTPEIFGEQVRELLGNEKRRNELHRLIKEVVKIGNEGMVKTVQSLG
jgi:UDP-N-acetylglucosamine--N-acetylmuramyl-(pentapeptide) pyrophosphoryl-undecaprenol N-acetylglucosamine transferase